MSEEWRSQGGSQNDPLGIQVLWKRRPATQGARQAECVQDAAEEWQQRHGRPMTTGELERVLRRYPGDV
jgi:hypothetical protein